MGHFCVSTLPVSHTNYNNLVLIKKKYFSVHRHLICHRKAAPGVTCEDEDEDVDAEHLRVASGAASSDILQVNKLTKVYRHLKKKVCAVKRISVGIPAGEASLYK